MHPLLAFVVLVVVGCLLYWAVMKVLAAFGIGDPIATVVQVLLVIFLVFAALDSFGVINLGVSPLRLR